MFRVLRQSRSSKAPFSRSLISLSLSAVLGFGLLLTPLQFQPADAGQGRITVKKMGGGAKARSHGSRSYGTRTISKKRMTGGQKITSRRIGGKTRTYTKRRSVLDGATPSVSGRQLYHRPVRGQGRYVRHNIKRYGKGRITKRRLVARGHGERIYSGSVSITGGADHSVGTARSGVKYVKRRHSGAHGLRHVAGHSGTRIIKRQLTATSNQNGSPPRAHGHRGVIVIAGTGSSSLTPIAGHDNTQGNMASDCAYGSYCTIDLGGPKIITFNDVADIRDGEYVDETMDDGDHGEK